MPHMNLSQGLLHFPPSAVSAKNGGGQIHCPGSTHFSFGRQSSSLLHWTWLAEHRPLYGSPVVPRGQTQLKDPMVSLVVIRDTENEPGVSGLAAHALCNTITKASHVPHDYQPFCMSARWKNYVSVIVLAQFDPSSEASMRGVTLGDRWLWAMDAG